MNTALPILERNAIAELRRYLLFRRVGLPIAASPMLRQRMEGWRLVAEASPGVGLSTTLKLGVRLEPRPSPDSAFECLQSIAGGASYGGTPSIGLRKIRLSGELIRVPDGFEANLRDSRQVEVHLRDALGGDGTAAQRMLAMLDSTPPDRVSMFADGVVASAHALLFVGARCARIIRPTGTLLLHKCVRALVGDAEEMRLAAEQLERCEAAWIERLAQRCGRSRDKVAGWFQSGMDTVFSAEAALAEGLVDRIEA